MIGRRVDNTAPAVVVIDDGTAKRGTVTLQSALDDGAGSGVASVRYQLRSSGGGAWADACAAAGAPFTCDLDTSSVADGLYELRATATDGAGLTTTSATIPAVRIDNAAPGTVTLADPPAAPLSGAVTLSGTATDAGSGIASVRFQYAPTGTGSWTDACTDASSPYSCAWSTAAAADGVYDLRALATDRAGNTRASAVVGRRVDNVAPSVALTDPGSPLRGTRTLAATAGDGGGIASVLIERKPSSGSTWTAICSDTTAPYSCSWNTTALADGSYDLRATATDNGGRTATSIVPARVVDNTGPRASAVASTSGGSPGTIGAGDALTLTYTEIVVPSSVIAGWNGAGRSVSIFFERSTATTPVTVTDRATGTPVPIGALALTGRFTGGAGATFDGTMTVAGSVLTLTLSGTATQGDVREDIVPAGLSWTSTTAVTDTAGNPGVATTVVGAGQL